MIPPFIKASGETGKQFPFGFRRRFFLALAFGFLWLLPAGSRPELAWGLVIWDLLVLSVWGWDVLRLPPAMALTASRTWTSPLQLAEPAGVTVRLFNTSRVAVYAELIDHTPAGLRESPATLTTAVAAGSSAEMTYAVEPQERGDQFVGNLFVRYGTSVSFGERWATIPLAQEVCVYAAAMGAKEQALYLMHSRQVDLQKRQRRQPGMGREFESLREYRGGDEMRDVSWTATARRHQLVSRVYTAERSQTVWVMVDAGRLLRARVAGFAKLDYAVNAALSLVQVAVQHGDQAGLLVYGRSIQEAVAPGRGTQQVRRVSEALAHVLAEPNEANHGKAVRLLMQRQSRLALVIWITDFAETAATPDVIEYAAYLGKRHLVLLGAMGQPDLQAVAQTIPETERDMYRHTAALEIATRRELLLRNLRQTGVLARELVPGSTVSSLVNEYLKIKDRNLL